MPLFECSKCSTVDNTALGNFWSHAIMDRKPALCTACDPTIGKWHGRFPRLTVAEYREQYPLGKIQYDADALAKLAAKPDVPKEEK